MLCVSLLLSLFWLVDAQLGRLDLVLAHFREPRQGLNCSQKPTKLAYTPFLRRFLASASVAALESQLVGERGFRLRLRALAVRAPDCQIRDEVVNLQLQVLDVGLRALALHGRCLELRARLRRQSA
jgi:hypothetical protein